MRHRDFEEFLASCNAHGVRYVIVGAHAVAFQAWPRATKDLDVYVEPSAESAERLLAAIREFFGGSEVGFTVEDVTEVSTILQLGTTPVRIDLLSSLPGIDSFERAWRQPPSPERDVVRPNPLAAALATLRAHRSSAASGDAISH